MCILNLNIIYMNLNFPNNLNYFVVIQILLLLFVEKVY